jgi:hypothetical protein
MGQHRGGVPSVHQQQLDGGVAGQPRELAHSQDG